MLREVLSGVSLCFLLTAGGSQKLRRGTVLLISSRKEKNRRSNLGQMGIGWERCMEEQGKEDEKNKRRSRKKKKCMQQLGE